MGYTLTVFTSGGGGGGIGGVAHAVEIASNGRTKNPGIFLGSCGQSRLERIREGCTGTFLCG